MNRGGAGDIRLLADVVTAGSAYPAPGADPVRLARAAGEVDRAERVAAAAGDVAAAASASWRISLAFQWDAGAG